MGVVFALGVSLRRADYLMKKDLKSYGLAPIDEDDVCLPYAATGLTVAGLPAVKVVSSGSSAKVVPPAAIPSLSTFMPPRVSIRAAATSIVMAMLRGASLHRKKSATVGPCKAPCIGVNNALERVIEGVAVSGRLATSTTTHG